MADLTAPSTHPRATSSPGLKQRGCESRPYIHTHVHVAPMGLLGRPPTGPGHYLRDLVYGGLDGCITTFAIVAGVAGADLGIRIVIILGLANLVADGISMGASNYLGLKSELEQRGESVALEKPWRHGAATLAAFVAVGAVPLVAFVAPLPFDPLLTAAVTSGIVLFAIGAARGRFIATKSPWMQGVEMLAVGVLAGGASYAIGAALKGLA